MAEGTRWQDIFNNLQKHDGQFEDLNQLCGSLQQRVEGLEGSVNEVKKDIKSLLEGFHKQPKIEFSRFNESDPRGWVRKSEEYFEFCPMEIERMVRYASIYFDGEAEHWFRTYRHSLQMFDICLFEFEGDSEVGRSTCIALINTCIRLKSVRGVKKVFNHMISSGFELDLFVRNMVLLMHVKCEMMLDAKLLFDEMPERNLVYWNTIIVGLLDSGYYIEAIRMFLSMWEVFSDADSRTFALMTRACATLEDIFLGEQLHSCALKMHLDADASVSCALIDMYSKCGCIEYAKCVFDKMPKKTTAGWNSIIAATVAEIKAICATEPILLNAVRGVEVERPPVWLMRQAGRYMKAG